MGAFLADADFAAADVPGIFAEFASDISGLADAIAALYQTAISGSFNSPVNALPPTTGTLERQDFFYDFYFRIWVTPSGIFNLGGISSEQRIAVDVWNAYPDSAQTLSAINATGMDDSSLIEPVSTPHTYAPLELQQYTLVVSSTGAPSIDILLDFVFDGLPLNSLEVTGFRAKVWPLQTDWREPPLDRYEWLTDVMESRSGFEQRVELREVPRRTIESTFVVTDNDLGWFDALLFAWGARGFLIPLWFDQSKLTQAFFGGGTRLFCDTTGREFGAGSYILIGSDLRTAFAAQVAEVFTDGVSTTRPVPGNYLTNDLIWPARAVRVTSPAQQAQHTAGVVEMRITFEVTDQPDITPVPSATLYKGLQVLTREHNWADDITRTYERKITILDNSTGSPLWIDLNNWAQITRQLNFLLASRVDRQNFIGWLSSVSGRCVPFWREDRETMLQMTVRQDPGATALLRIVPIDFPTLLYGMPNRMAIVLRHIDGSVYYATVLTAATDVVNGDELLTLDVNLPASVPSDWRLITYLELMRLDADAIEIAHASDEVAQVQMTIRGIKQ